MVLGEHLPDSNTLEQKDPAIGAVIVVSKTAEERGCLSEKPKSGRERELRSPGLTEPVDSVTSRKVGISLRKSAAGVLPLVEK